VVGRLRQGGFGRLHIELDQLFHAFKGFLGQAEQGFDGRFLGSQDLFCGQHIHISFKLILGCCCSASIMLNAILLRCNIGSSIDNKTCIASAFAAMQHF
jgi:hypothetical protein